MAIKPCWQYMHNIPHEPHPRGLDMDDECLGVDPTEATGMQCGKSEPHPAHDCEYEPSHSPIPIPWRCDGVDGPVDPPEASVDLPSLVQDLRDASHESRVKDVTTSDGRLSDLLRRVANDLQQVIDDPGVRRI